MSVCKDRASIAKRVKLNVVLFLVKRGTDTRMTETAEKERDMRKKIIEIKKKKIGKCH